MRKALLIFILISLSCFAGKLNINFNDASPSVVIDFNDIDNIEIVSDMIFVQGGIFDMGDNFYEGNSNELPIHSITLGNFLIGKCEVTQYEWTQYMSADTYDCGSGDNYPVYYVSWYKVLVYCNKRSEAEGLTPCYSIRGTTNTTSWSTIPTSSNSTWDAVICDWRANGYRLPSEAEWEYASRGGIHSTDNFRYSGCLNEAELTDFAWYDGNYTGESHPVGTKADNQLGIFDMTGNVWEWCWDLYSESYYQDCIDDSISLNPYGPVSGSFRIGRGGGWFNDSGYCRVAYRGYDFPYSNYDYLGFRVARTP